jgi:hypothetical protein
MPCVGMSSPGGCGGPSSLAGGDALFCRLGGRQPRPRSTSAAAASVPRGSWRAAAPRIRSRVLARRPIGSSSLRAPLHSCLAGAAARERPDRDPRTHTGLAESCSAFYRRPAGWRAAKRGRPDERQDLGVRGALVERFQCLGWRPGEAHRAGLPEHGRAADRRGGGRGDGGGAKGADHLLLARQDNAAMPGVAQELAQQVRGRCGRVRGGGLMRGRFVRSGAGSGCATRRVRRACGRGAYAPRLDGRRVRRSGPPAPRLLRLCPIAAPLPRPRGRASLLRNFDVEEAYDTDVSRIQILKPKAPSQARAADASCLPAGHRGPAAAAPLALADRSARRIARARAGRGRRVAHRPPQAGDQVVQEGEAAAAARPAAEGGAAGGVAGRGGGHRQPWQCMGAGARRRVSARPGPALQAALPTALCGQLNTTLPNPFAHPPRSSWSGTSTRRCWSTPT